ncbi:TonB-dependent receptor [Vibrio chagasii]|nr:TonB-dependent receptor [Vibrio chagasii]
MRLILLSLRILNTTRTNVAYFAALNADADKVFGELSRVDDNEQFGTETTYNTGLGYRYAEWLTFVKAAYGTSFKAPFINYIATTGMHS